MIYDFYLMPFLYKDKWINHLQVTSLICKSVPYIKRDWLHFLTNPLFCKSIAEVVKINGIHSYEFDTFLLI